MEPQTSGMDSRIYQTGSCLASKPTCHQTEVHHGKAQKKKKKKTAERQRSLISRVECGTHCLGKWTTDGSKDSRTWKSGKIQEDALIGRDEVDIFGDTGKSTLPERFIIKKGL